MLEFFVVLVVVGGAWWWRRHRIVQRERAVFMATTILREQLGRDPDVDPVDAVNELARQIVYANNGVRPSDALLLAWEAAAHVANGSEAWASFRTQVALQKPPLKRPMDPNVLAAVVVLGLFCAFALFVVLAS